MGQNQSTEDPSLTVSPGGTPHMMAPGSHPNTSSLNPSNSGSAIPTNAPLLQQLMPNNRQASATQAQQQQQQQQSPHPSQHINSPTNGPSNSPPSAASNIRTQSQPPNGTNNNISQPPSQSSTNNPPPPFLHHQQPLSHLHSSPSNDPQPQPSPSPSGPQSLSQQVIDLMHDPTLPSQSPLMPALTAVAEETIPTEFKWIHGGDDVYVCGSFNNWQGKIQMGKEPDGDFHLILSLTPGHHSIRYVVDGRWEVDKDGNVVVDQINPPYNIVSVQRPVFEYQLGNYADSDDDDVDERKNRTEYARTAPRVEDYVTNPVKLPPQLTTIILQQGEEKAVESNGIGGQLLPVPQHVILNHLYILPSVDRELLITGITQRFKPNSHTKITHKFVTTVFYQPKPTLEELVAAGSGGMGGGVGGSNGPAGGVGGGAGGQLPYVYYEGGMANGGMMMGGMMQG